MCRSWWIRESQAELEKCANRIQGLKVVVCCLPEPFFTGEFGISRENATVDAIFFLQSTTMADNNESADGKDDDATNGGRGNGAEGG